MTCSSVSLRYERKSHLNGTSSFFRNENGHVIMGAVVLRRSSSFSRHEEPPSASVANERLRITKGTLPCPAKSGNKVYDQEN
jgi:hypothetical protein